ncbi:MAG: TolC family outer membrane protein [Pseudomonadales bacterium]
MLKSVRLTLTLLALTGPMAGHAEDLLEIYQTAWQNDPVLGAARAGYDAREQAVPLARAALLPNITAGAQTNWNEREFPGNSQFNQDFNDNGWQARLAQPIVDVESWFNLRSAKASVQGAELDLRSQEQQLISRVVGAYLNVLRAQDLLESTMAEEAAVKRQLEQVQQRFDVGLVAITDVLEAQAAYDNSVVRRIQADSDQDIYFESLRTLTGESYNRLARISEDLPIVNPQPRNEDEWLNVALESNLNILAAEAQLKAAERNLQARRSGHLPTVDATATHNYNKTGGTSFLGSEVEQTVYGLTITLPIYQGGFTSARTSEARAQMEQARQQLVAQQLTVTRDTRNLFRAVATDVVRVRARARSIESAQSALEATQTGYEVGTRNIVDVLQAQQRLYLSQFDYADSRYNYMLDLMGLKQAVGTLSEEDLAEFNRFADSANPVERVNSLRNRSADLGDQ